MILFVVSTTKRPDIVLYALDSPSVPTVRGKIIARYAENNLHNVSTKKIKGFVLSVMANTLVHTDAFSTTVNNARALSTVNITGRSLHAESVEAKAIASMARESLNANCVLAVLSVLI